MVSVPASSMDTSQKFNNLPSNVSISKTNDKALSDTDLVIEHARQASSQLKAMAHETRLAILFHLYNGDKSVNQLEKLLKLRQPAVSQQLARLRSDHMVSTTRQGKQVYYSLTSQHAFIIVELMQRLYADKPEQKML